MRFSGLASVLAASAIASGCQFDTSTRARSDGAFVSSDGASANDAGTDSSTSPGDCPSELHIAWSVNGISEPPSSLAPYVTAFVGDTITLSATGSCSRSGALTYRWRIEPSTSLITETIQPNSQNETISLYPTAAERYTVQLEIGDETGQTLSHEFFAFEAVGFHSVPSVATQNVRDVYAGKDHLWVATELHALRVNLSDPLTTPSPTVNELYDDGDRIPLDVETTHEDQDGRFVWFGERDSNGVIYRLDLDLNTIDAIDIFEDTRVRDITNAESGVRVATDDGVFVAPRSENFELEHLAPARAVWFGAEGAWAGGSALYSLPSGVAFPTFGEADNRIRAIVDDGTNLWVAGQGKGIARLKDGLVQDGFTKDNSGLNDNETRSMAVDSAKDVWAATRMGVSRYKRDRRVWVPLTSGLGDLDLNTITIDERDGRRAVYVGSNAGLHVLSISPK